MEIMKENKTLPIPQKPKQEKFLPNIPKDNITELNELIHAGAKLVCDKIGIPQETGTEIQNLNGKLG